MVDRVVIYAYSMPALPWPDRVLKRTLFYREIMRPQGWRHAVSLCFWGEPVGPAPIFVLSAYRDERHRDSSDLDVRHFEQCVPFIDSAVNRVREREDAEVLQAGLSVAMHDGADGCAILDHRLRVVRATPVARTLCAAWSRDAVDTDDGDRGRRLPAVIEAACQELLEQWRSLPAATPISAGVSPRRQIASTRDPDVTANITMVRPKIAGLGEPTFIVEFEARASHGRPAGPGTSSPMLEKMTSAERSVAAVLTEGLSNQEIADRLGKSVHAIKFLLHSIYRKTGVPSRTGLVAALRSTPPVGGRRDAKSQIAK